jgi:peptidyl-dipeptidase Dcp
MKGRKEQYAAINKKLSSLYTSYANNVLADEEKYVTYLPKSNWVACPSLL